MNLLQKRIQKIKEALKASDLRRAASLLISTVASDDMFGYWSSCCQGSERVPKILQYVKHITFDEHIPTASIDLLEGDLRIGPQFFIEHIDGPEDLLLLLIHERNHLILRSLYPEVPSKMDWPSHMFNFAEDVYINAISRRHIPSTLPERFYKRPVEMLLTGKHSQVDWNRIHFEEFGCNVLKEAHGTMYRQNGALLQVLGEDNVKGNNFGGYQEWMALAYRWHKHMQAESQKQDTQTSVVGDEAPVEEDIRADTGSDDQATEEIKDEQLDQEPGSESANTEGEADAGPRSQQGPEDDQGQEDGSEQEVSASETDGNESVEGDERRNADHGPFGTPESPDEDMETVLKSIVPLVQEDENSIPSGRSNGQSYDESGLQKIPVPGLKPNDPVVRLILSTCDLPELRYQVRIFEGDMLDHVEGLISGVLSDRATERSYDGYSISVPFSITRRDVFSLCAGEIPVLWQKRVGIERPNIDLYVDVSGSMNRYYGYIPYIYDALKHVTGKIYQFSTRIVEVDHKDMFLHTTGGTNFNAVAEHMVEQQVRSAILLSDGKCLLSEEHIERLRGQLELFVYIKVKENQYKNWEHIATDVIVLEERR